MDPAVSSVRSKVRIPVSPLACQRSCVDRCRLESQGPDGPGLRIRVHGRHVAVAAAGRIDKCSIGRGACTLRGSAALDSSAISTNCVCDRRNPSGRCHSDQLTGRGADGLPPQKRLPPLSCITQANRKASDLVLNPFFDCTTTCVATDLLGRQRDGIDISSQAVAMVNGRQSH